MTQYNASVTDSSNMKGANKKVKVRKRVQETPKGAEEKELLPKDEGDKQQLNDEPPAISEKKEDVMVFEGLCERMLSAMCLLQTSVSEVLDVKDELIIHNVPSCVQGQMSLSTSRLFRSLTDMYVPSTELVRLVRVFGPQWEQKQLILKQLQEEHERLQRLLSLALQRIQHLETQLHRDTESQHYKNWEKLFVRLMRMGPDISSFEIQSDLDIKR